MDDSKLEVFALKSDNIQLVKAEHAAKWKEEERKYMEVKKAIDHAEKLKRDEQERKLLEDRRKKESGRRLGLQEDLPDMDLSELVEAEMSGLPIDEAGMDKIRSLSPERALELLKELHTKKYLGNLGTMIDIRVAQILGHKAQIDALMGNDSNKRVVPEPESSSEEEDDAGDDPGRYKEESDPMPALPAWTDKEPSEEQMDTQNAAKKEVAEALSANDQERALAKYTEVVVAGGGTALTLAKRAELLLNLKRPCGAIRDCDAAIQRNNDCGKAYRVRGMAYRRLGHWREAHKDLTHAQTADFDDATAEVLKFVDEKVKALDEKKSKKREAKRARA
jgi:tetratricopeptide (TPR) repeat protein